MAFDKSRILAFINNGMIRQAFNALRLAALEGSVLQIVDRLNAAEDTYRYMIHYLVQGTKDDVRADMYNDIKAQLMRAADMLDLQLRMKDDDSPYAAEMRIRQMRPVDVSDLFKRYETQYNTAMFASESGSYDAGLFAESENTLKEIFLVIWATPFLPNDTAGAIASVLSSQSSSEELKSQIISALMLGSLFFYDSTKLRLLLDSYLNGAPSDTIAARLLVAILIICMNAGERVALDSEIRHRLEALNDSLISFQRLRVVILNLVKAFDTDRINKKMKEEVIPEVMKIQPEIMKRMREMQKDADTMSPELNPEWEEILEKNGVGDKLRELQDLQMEGGDVMMFAFSNLKNFPFFSHIANWFLPFSQNHSTLGTFRNLNSPLADMLTDSHSGICSSDKYSFALSVDRMPEMQRNAMLGGLGEQMAQMKEEFESSLKKLSQARFDAAVTEYVRDIYRFFRLYPKRESFPDPFSKPLDFSALPVIGKDLTDDSTLSLIGEFFFKHGYYSLARRLFTLLETDGSNQDIHLFEKIGFCHQMEKDFIAALDYYRKAELLNADSKWLWKKLAFANRALGNFKEAEVYYGKLIANDPDNIQLTMNLGHCLAEEKKWEEALSCFYKVNYLAPDNAKALRAIAWCEMQLHNFDKSRSFYDRILLSDPAAEDYLNAGHLALIEGDIRRAVELYAQRIGNDASRLPQLRNELLEDAEMLGSHGVDTSILPLLTDKIQYDTDK